VIPAPSSTEGSVGTLEPVTLRPSVWPVPAVKAQARAKNLPLTGTHACALDENKGLILPKVVRAQLGENEALFVTPTSDTSLWLTTGAGLEKLTDRLEKSSEADAEAQAHRRRYFAHTIRVTVDRNGRVQLPTNLAEVAELKQDVVLIGVGDHLEIWDTQRWRHYSEEAGSAVQDAAGNR
jgi:MraZ protein